MENQVKSFLDEGFDFIEESVSTCPLEFTESNGEIIVESENGEKSPYHVLGVCRGVFQPINEPSRNGRIYESNHWNLQLDKPEVQERIKSRSMWGTLGHFDRRITDSDVREGLVSHIISKLDIREDVNGKPYLYGELEILDTPSGRILEGMYKGGANLFVSSRGAGKLISVAGDTMKHVDPNSFWFEGFDIVRAPGFLKARPVYESVVSEDRKEAVHESVEVSSISSAQEATNEELTTIKSQIDKLAKIVEKVVDDVYEEDETSKEKPEQKELEKKPEEAPQMQEQPIAPVKEEKEVKSFQDYKKESDSDEKRWKEATKDLINPDGSLKCKKNEALVDFVQLMASTNISEEVFEGILDMLVKAKKGGK